MGQSRVEKIAQRFAVGAPGDLPVRAGHFLSLRPLHVMTHDNTAAVIPKFEQIGATRIHDPSQPVFCLDHDIQNTSPENIAKYKKIEEFARRHGISFFQAGQGIGHQIMVEEGFVLPGSVVVASDSHSNSYGALGALGTPVVRTDAAAIWATGRTWWQVPEVAQVTLVGKLRPGVTGKDVIVALIGAFDRDEVLNTCVEFDGPGVASLSMDQRFTIANMTTEWGALAGVFPADDITRNYLLGRAEVMRRRGVAEPRLTAERVEAALAGSPVADPDAGYAKRITFDLSDVTPFVAGPNEVKTIVPVDRIEKLRIKIDRAFLLSCVNGRLEDFADAARLLEGRRVAPWVRLYIAAASREVEDEAKRSGYWKTLLDAGAIAFPPGCGPCIGLGDGVLTGTQVGISATNRNFKGRMGSRDAQVYLASPAVVAASALAGHIAGPALGSMESPGKDAAALRQASRLEELPARAGSSATVAIRKGFPAVVEGELLYVPKDNMNTDGIYGKDVTYNENLTREEMGRAAMANYDPAFQQIARAGDLLVGGMNFGTGSSREQAATALKYRGIQLVIAGSFSQTYSRNAFNNGFLVIQCPELVRDLADAFRDAGQLTIRTGWRAMIDFARSQLECRGRCYPFPPLGDVAQELIVLGGLEAALGAQLKTT
ncbi:MAG: homoaconitase [Candidatus Riflebacteria bacterium]|nr:homoaconitase [Candidatus Riflebacteria bacterium]